MEKLTLKQARQRKKLTLKSVAEYIGIIPNTLWNWEIGKTAPDVDKFADLLEIYGVRFEDVDLPIKRQQNQ